MFIRKLGQDYANDNLSGAHFVHCGKVYRYRHVDGDSLYVYNLSDGDGEVLSADVVVGWKSFKYPRLGYRKLHGLATHVSRQPRCYTRGLSLNNLNVDILIGQPNLPFDIYCRDEWIEENAEELLVQALSPEYDDKDGFGNLISGSTNVFVPSAITCMYRDETGSVRVHVSGMEVGRLNRGKVLATKPNAAIINNIVRKYAP